MDDPNLQTTVELNDAEAQSGTVEHTLPPVDGGRDAWLVLSSCFVLGILIWGKFRSASMELTSGELRTDVEARLPVWLRSVSRVLLASGTILGRRIWHSCRWNNTIRTSFSPRK